MPLSLLHMLYVSPTERLQALQQDRQELFLLMGIAIGLLILAFVLLVVVIFRKQKAKKEALSFHDSTENPKPEDKDEQRFAPQEPITPIETESSTASTAVEENTIQDELPSPNPSTSEGSQDDDHQPSAEPEYSTQELPSEPTRPEEPPAPQETKSETPPEPPKSTPTPPESQSESNGNLSPEQVGQKVEEALKGAKSAEENRKAIQAYLEELRQRKANTSTEVEEETQKKQEPTTPVPTEDLQAQVPSSSQVDSEQAQDSETTQMSSPEDDNLPNENEESNAESEQPGSTSIVSQDSKPEPHAMALIPPFVPSEEDSEIKQTPEHTINPIESTEVPSFEVEWDSVQEEQPPVRYLPAAPGDLKSFADWLKEFKRP